MHHTEGGHVNPRVVKARIAQSVAGLASEWLNTFARAGSHPAGDASKTYSLLK